jgi:delta 1-pyrroline-5-carboxylate dehydrogenase
VFAIDRATGQATHLCSVPDQVAEIDAISFTGSQFVGGKVAENAIKRQARVQLEMGGKNPLVVLDDADLERAVTCAIDGAFFGTGQRCTASSRVIVTEGIHDRFVEALAERARGLKVGDSLDPTTQIGPVVSESQLEQDLKYIRIATDEGGRLVTGGELISMPTPGLLPQWMKPSSIHVSTVKHGSRPGSTTSIMLWFGSAAARWAAKSPGQFIIVTGSSKPAHIWATCMQPVKPVCPIALTL